MKLINRAPQTIQSGLCLFEHTYLSRGGKFHYKYCRIYTVASPASHLNIKRLLCKQWVSVFKNKHQLKNKLIFVLTQTIDSTMIGRNAPFQAGILFLIHGRPSWLQSKGGGTLGHNFMIFSGPWYLWTIYLASDLSLRKIFYVFCAHGARANDAKIVSRLGMRNVKQGITWSPVHTRPDELENGALFLRLGLQSTLIWRNCPPKTELFENALDNGGIWKRSTAFLVWTENILKTELCVFSVDRKHFENGALRF